MHSLLKTALAAITVYSSFSGMSSAHAHPGHHHHPSPTLDPTVCSHARGISNQMGSNSNVPPSMVGAMKSYFDSACGVAPHHDEGAHEGSVSGEEHHHHDEGSTKGEEHHHHDSTSVHDAHHHHHHDDE